MKSIRHSTAWNTLLQHSSADPIRFCFSPRWTTGGPFPEESSQFVPIFVIPPECGCGGGPGEIVAVPDQYYVPPFQSTFFASQDAGLLANDFSPKESFFFAISETVTTDLGGTVEIFSDGSFFYTPPTLANPNFVDSFVYFASDEISISNPGFVTLFVGQVPVPEDIDVPLTLFNVEFGTPSEMVIVDLSTVQGGTLTLLDTLGMTFLAGSNGGTSFTITGFYDDVNFALDTLHYRSPLNYSGLDFVNFDVAFPDRFGPAFMQESPGFPSQHVVINVLPIADAPLLSIAPQPVVYQPGVPVPVDINVALLDVDGSEIPGLVILDFVPPGVVPSAGQQLPHDPKVYLLLPSELEGLTFFVDASAPPNFHIVVIATSIETTNQPGVFGGPGGPLVPNNPMEPRFALSSQLLMFIRQGSEGLPPVGLPPVGPPPNLPVEQPHTEVVFLLGPLSAPPLTPLHHHGPDPGPQHAHHVAATVIEAHHHHGLEHHSGTFAVFADDAIELGSDAATAEEQSNEQSLRSFGSPGIYLRRLGSDDPSQIARLPEELSENYSRFMDFLKTLPNGDYVVYFKRAGQPHAEAEVRQVVVRVRVVNHRLNPDPGEFKPAGEVTEPPQDPNLPMVPATTEASLDQRAELPQTQESEAPIAAGTGWAALIAWKLQQQRQNSSTRIDQLMERFLRKPSSRFRRSKQLPHS